MREAGLFVGHTSCEACGSSDANAVYDNEDIQTTYCFACQATGTQEEEITIQGFDKVNTEVPQVPTLSRGFRDRKITRAAAEFFNVTVAMSGEAITHHYYPYTKSGTVTGYKVRQVDGKIFKAIGDKKNTDLFGQSKFSQGGQKLVIVEGELDALAVAQSMLDEYKKVFPVVSVPDGAQSAAKSILANREWVRSFNEVIIMFDQDTPGQDGANEAAKVIGADKAKIAKLTTKDASDEYLALGAKGISSAVWNAAQWQPAGIINAKDTWEVYQSEKDAEYQSFPPFLEALNEKIHGTRTGSITMLTSGTGCGKTTFVKENIYHILRTTQDQIGLVSLEESTSETVRGFLSLDLSKRVGLPGVVVSIEEEKAAFDRTLGTGRILMLDHQGSCEDTSLVDKLEFLALSGCRHIVLDHITIAVSESRDGNTNQAIDSLMSQLLKITKKHDVHITCISHLRKVGGGNTSFEDGGDISMDDLRGSGSLKQISAQVIALSRNLSAESELERHTVKVKVLKDRWTGATGWAGCYQFDHATGRLKRAQGAFDSNGFTMEG